MFINQSDLPDIVEQISPGRGQSQSIVRLARPVAGDATVLKIYKEQAAPSRTQAQMLLQAGQQLSQQYPVAYRRIAWPRAFVLTASGNICGAVMPMAPDEVFYQDGDERHPCKVELMMRPESRIVSRTGLMTPDINLRLRFCLALTAIILRIHAVKGLYCDFSQSNLLWTCDPAANDMVCVPYLLDADGIVIGTHRNDIYTANWKDEYPRADKRADAATDVYKLALTIYRVINLTFQLPPPGQYRIDPSHQIPGPVAAQLETAINQAAGPRAGRPPIGKLHACLRDARIQTEKVARTSHTTARPTPARPASTPSTPKPASRHTIPVPRHPAPPTKPHPWPTPASRSHRTREAARRHVDKAKQALNSFVSPRTQGAAATLLAVGILAVLVRMV